METKDQIGKAIEYIKIEIAPLEEDTSFSVRLSGPFISAGESGKILEAMESALFTGRSYVFSQEFPEHMKVFTFLRRLTYLGSPSRFTFHGDGSATFKFICKK